MRALLIIVLWLAWVGVIAEAIFLSLPHPFYGAIVIALLGVLPIIAAYVWTRWREA